MHLTDIQELVTKVSSRGKKTGTGFVVNFWMEWIERCIAVSIPIIK